jgi:hypothetical protein
MIATDYVTISSNQRVASDRDWPPGPQVCVPADKHVSSSNHGWFAVRLGRTPNSAFALNHGADAKFQPWLHVSAPGQFNRFVNQNSVSTHFSQPGLAQAPSVKAMIRVPDCRFQKTFSDVVAALIFGTL